MSFSPEQQQLLSVLLATQQPETIKAAEAQLAKYAAEYQGYALLMMSLLQPALAEAIGKDTQTAIAVNLKRYVLTHWCTSVPTFTPPQVPDSEKAEVHRHILSLLATPYSGVRRQLSQTINEIAESDFPEKWNNLLPDVLAILHQAAQAGHDATPAQTNLLVGTLGSLSDFTAQMEDHQLVTTIPTLFPALLELCQKKFEVIMQVQRASPLPALDAAQQQAVKDALQVCTFAIKVYESCCQSINMMNISANDDARQRGKKKATDLNKVLNEFLIPSLPTWWGFFTTILTMPAGSGVFDFAHAFPTSWGLRLEAVKCLTNLSERFGADILARGVDGAAMYERALATLMDGLTNAYPMYEKTVLNTDDDASEEEERDEDDNPISMSVFVFDTFGHFRSVLSMRPPPKMKPTKGKATKPTLAAQINAAKHAGYDHIKGLFGPANNFLQRLLQLSLQYGQLSSREVAASLSDMVEYLSSSAPSSHSDGDDGIGSSVNARLGVKDLFMDCILWHAGAEKDEDVDELEAMGYMGMGGPDGDGAGSVMIDRRYVLQVLCPLLTELLKHSLSLRESDANWWKGRELATLLVGYIVGDIIEAQAAASASPQPKTKGGKKQEQQQQQVQPPSFDLQSFIRDILMPDLSFTNASRRNHALLRAQTLTSTARFAPVFLKAQEKNLVVLALEEIVRNMQPESEAAPTTLLTRIAAVDAFGTLCGEIDKELLMHNNILHGALTNICQLIHSAAQRDVDGPEVDEPSLVKVIQTLIMAISVNQQVSPACFSTSPHARLRVR
jgi:hypothetical protein